MLKISEDVDKIKREHSTVFITSPESDPYDKRADKTYNQVIILYVHRHKKNLLLAPTTTHMQTKTLYEIRISFNM